MKHLSIFSFLLCAASLTALTSCSENEPAGGTVTDGDPGHVQVIPTYNSLTFTWDKIEGVNQFGYTLSDAQGEVVEDGLTDAHSVTIGDLLTDAPYSFELRVYGSAGETSYRTVMQTRTYPIQKLATPQFVVSQEGSYLRVDWEPVTGLDYVVCTYEIGGMTYTKTATEGYCLVAGLAPGTHSLILNAYSNSEGYTPADAVTVQGTRSRNEVKQVTGTYTCGLMPRNNTWSCTMHVYDDGTYMIESFYENGKDLDFYVDRDEATGEPFIGIYNFVSMPDSYQYLMETGRASVPEITICTGKDEDGVYQSSFTGDANSGSISFVSVYKTSKATDKFEW